MKKSNIKVTLVRSTIGSTEKQRMCVRGLGLKKIRSHRDIEGTPENYGMINKVSHLVKVEEIK